MYPMICWNVMRRHWGSRCLLTAPPAPSPSSRRLIQGDGGSCPLCQRRWKDLAAVKILPPIPLEASTYGRCLERCGVLSSLLTNGARSSSYMADCAWLFRFEGGQEDSLGIGACCYGGHRRRAGVSNVSLGGTPQNTPSPSSKTYLCVVTGCQRGRRGDGILSSECQWLQLWQRQVTAERSRYSNNQVQTNPKMNQRHSRGSRSI
ncbi:hypothetical protein BD309DRAFT_951803 [Dichomitus squalens]|nr:hypothetical protein BD309DRAFT_951803 [Dichomitus squalens]